MQLKSLTAMKTGLMRAAVGLTLLLGIPSLRSQTITLDISALIDGRDQLIIHDDSLIWHHFDFGAVGRHEGANEPTVITTLLDGQIVLDHINWIPEWPEPPPAEIRYEATSSTFSALTPSIPLAPTSVTLHVVQARGSISIVELPSITNNFTTVIDFNDNPLGSSATYEAQLVFTIVPEPSQLWMIALGATLLVMTRWRSIRRA